MKFHPMLAMTTDIIPPQAKIANQ